MTIRTRFAPSPTGYLHLGSARTALFCWAFARRHKGEFILRVEDTDRERSTQEAIEVILDSMDWLGMDYDEGPFYQTHRFDRYADVINQLLETGHAYRCTCSKERLASLREEQMANKVKPRYDGHCREANLGADVGDHVIRFKNPEAGTVSFDDSVHGFIEIANVELDDLIIARTDGTPTYNFCVVVDDWDMNITHVVRGTDHINNTPRQINILLALKAPVPQYAHVPMILGPDGKKLSKRHGAVSVLHYREAGYLPESMLNALIRLGWSHGDQEIFSVDEMIELFDIAHINKAGACFDPAKLDHLNQHYIKTLPPSEISEPLNWHFEQHNVAPQSQPPVNEVITLQADRVKTLKELAEKSLYFYRDVGSYDEKAAKKFLTPETKVTLQAIADGVTEVESWSVEECHRVIHEVAAKLELKLGKVAQPIRVALTGNTISPSIDATMALLGKETVLKRINHAIGTID